MSMIDTLKEELLTGLNLIAYKSFSVQVPSIGMLNLAMAAIGWTGVSEVEKSPDGIIKRYFYGTAQKNYALATLNNETGDCELTSVEEGDVLEKLSFDELKVLAGLIDKKSVAFIRIYSEKELSSATDEERAAIQERNQRMIDEAEVALRKR
ncbi:MAG: hypothetical protein IJU66_08005 [Oscillospiraceae bacterium]|nr:hypothetical protein [Oscillospiraceae bacterium]